MTRAGPLARELKRIRETAGLSMREVAEALGLSITGYQHYEDRYKKDYLPPEIAEHLQKLLRGRGLTDDELSTLNLGKAPVPRRPSHPLGERDLPVLGGAQGGMQGVLTLAGEAVDWVHRPAELNGVRDAFAVFMAGESMEPKYQAGDTLFIHPHIQPRPGDHILIQLATGEALVKRLSRRTQTIVYVEQYNPPRVVEIPSESISRIQLVIGSMDRR